jgi:hypothetical protein
MKHPSVVNLHNIVTVAKSGIERRVAKLSEKMHLDPRRARIYTLGREGP